MNDLSTAAYRLIALYLPQFHPIAENDRWWGKGYTEWTATGRAKPLFKGHYQPRVPADLGYYDLRLPEVREAQAAMAREAGIEGFCYWHYWFGNGKRLLDRPFREVLESGKPDFPFCLAWANESWKGFLHGLKNRNTLIEQKYFGADDYKAHFHAVLPAFRDHRYIRVHDKPLFMIYQPLDFPEIQLFIEIWQALARQNGLKGIYFVGQSYSIEKINLILQTGFDAFNLVRLSYYYMANSVKPLSKPGILNIYRYADAIKKLVGTEEKEQHVIPTVIPNWDHSPRSGKEAIILHQSTPQLFEKHLKQVLKTICHKPGQERIAFLKSWNEWGEGNYLEPDLVYGKSYLEVIKKTISGSMINDESIKPPRLRKKTVLLQQLKEMAIMFAGSGHTCAFPGLMNGRMGIVIFLFHYIRQTGDSSFEDVALNLLNGIQADIHIHSPLDYNNGLTGIGAGIEYLAQQGFLYIDTDEVLDDFDSMFAEQLREGKLYLSMQDVFDLRRYFSVRLENPRTKKQDLLRQAKHDCIALLKLHGKVSVTMEAPWNRKPLPVSSKNWGLKGLSGKGLARLTELNPQHNTWFTLR